MIHEKISSLKCHRLKSIKNEHDFDNRFLYGFEIMFLVRMPAILWGVCVCETHRFLPRIHDESIHSKQKRILLEIINKNADLNSRQNAKNANFFVAINLFHNYLNFDSIPKKIR